MHVDIKHGEDDVTRLSIYEGDNVMMVVTQFASRYGISQEVKGKLMQYVKTQIERLKEDKLASEI